MAMIKACRVCGKDFFVKDAHAHKRFNCSRDCMAGEYRITLKGASNPNFRDIPDRTCVRCGGLFRVASVGIQRKYCSRICAGTLLVEPKQKKPKPIRRVYTCHICGVVVAAQRKCCDAHVHVLSSQSIKARVRSVMVACAQCSKEFRKYPSGTRRFCSYACFVANGGPFRAGIEASKMKQKYGAKKDANHSQIVAVFQRMGITFIDMSAFGCGLPDGFAFVGGVGYLVEFKNLGTPYGRRGLNEIQRKWLSQTRNVKVYILCSEDDAVAFCSGRLHEVKSISSDEAAASLLTPRMGNAA